MYNLHIKDITDVLSYGSQAVYPSMGAVEGECNTHFSS